MQEELKNIKVKSCEYIKLKKILSKYIPISIPFFILVFTFRESVFPIIGKKIINYSVSSGLRIDKGVSYLIRTIYQFLRMIFLWGPIVLFCKKAKDSIQRKIFEIMIDVEFKSNRITIDKHSIELSEIEGYRILPFTNKRQMIKLIVNGEKFVFYIDNKEKEIVEEYFDIKKIPIKKQLTDGYYQSWHILIFIVPFLLVVSITVILGNHLYPFLYKSL